MADDDKKDETTDDKKDETTDTKPPTTDDKKDDKGAGGSDDSDTTKNLRTIVREELAALYKAGEGRGTNRASIEDRAEALVQEASARLENKKKDEDRDKEVTSLKEQVKALTERPPIKQGRLSKVLWGDAGKDR